jgi:hypothetical protein
MNLLYVLTWNRIEKLDPRFDCERLRSLRYDVYRCCDDNHLLHDFVFKDLKKYGHLIERTITLHETDQLTKHECVGTQAHLHYLLYLCHKKEYKS